MSKFELRQDKGHGSETLFAADSLEEIAEFAAEKSGEDPFGIIMEGD